MRFSDRITLYTETEGGYDPSTGKHEEPKITDKTLPCKLSQLGINRTNELFGQIDIKVIVARLQHPYNEQIDYAIVNDGKFKGKYHLKRQSDYRKGVLFLESVIEDG